MVNDKKLRHKKDMQILCKKSRLNFDIFQPAGEFGVFCFVWTA